MTYDTFADVSHWNVSVDLAKYPHKRIGLKATEGSTVDPTYRGRVADSHKRTIEVAHYCFGEPGDAAAQARFFIATVSPTWQPNDTVVLDCEVKGVTAAFVNEFIATVNQERPHWDGKIYGSPGFLEPAGIRPSHGWGLWVAEYTAAAEPESVTGWSEWDWWQFTSSASVQGVTGKCDLSRIAPAPAPKPVPGSPLIPATVAAAKAGTSNCKTLNTNLGKRHEAVAAENGERDLLVTFINEASDAVAQARRVLALKP